MTESTLEHGVCKGVFNDYKKRDQKVGNRKTTEAGDPHGHMGIQARHCCSQVNKDRQGLLEQWQGFIM